MPGIKLSAEMKQKLVNLEGEISDARKEIETAKSVGIDVKQFEDQLNKVVKLRESILKHYG